MDISVIIVNYNTKQLTKECIDSIFLKTSGVDFEVILVDNASSDGSQELFKKDQRVTFVESESNLGFGRANNLGYQYARGKYIFLLNSDTLLLNNAVKIFFDYAERLDSQVACLGSLLLDIDGNFIHSYAKFPSVLRIALQLINQYTSLIGCNLSGYNPNVTEKDLPLRVDYVTGADLFIRRSVIEQLGLFNPAFFMYYEETEMQYRYKKHGYYSEIVSGPKIIHYNGSGRKKKKSMKGMYISTQGCFTYCELIFDTISYLIIRILYVILLLPKIILYPISLKEKLKYLSLLCCHKGLRKS